MSGDEGLSVLAASRAARLVTGSAPDVDPRVLSGLQADFADATARAEELVSRATGLVAHDGGGHAAVVSRSQWVEANLDSLSSIAAPLFQRAPRRSLPGARSFGSLAGAVSGAEIGLVLGWMSGRVLGQYDLFSTGSERHEPGAVYYVGANILALEQRYGFPPSEFRLWIALHEVTHRLQFVGVPWLRDYFLGLVEASISMAAIDGRQLLDGARRVVLELRSGRNPLAESGLAGLVASGAQLEALEDARALMSLLEGHGDVTMDRAGAELVPSAPRFAEVLHARRNEAHGILRILSQLLGLEAKLRQYEEGERFVAFVEQAGGEELFSRVFEAPQMLPSLAEIRSPQSWVDRVHTASLSARR